MEEIAEKWPPQGSPRDFTRMVIGEEEWIEKQIVGR